MARFQRPDGAWWAVAQEPASGDESSTAAFMATAFRRGAESGLLEAGVFMPAGERAWEATLSTLGDDGVLAGVSAAVWSCTSLEHYFHVPRGFTVPWGQGPLLTAARAWLR
jgi:unsaturated rhamnogalacturonyl hydrolase